MGCSQGGAAMTTDNQSLNTLQLLNTDGENRPVRWFLAAYGGGTGMTVGRMKKHLKCCGYPFWPAWCDEPGEDAMHLTKGGAQLWLRHLFNLEELK